MATNFWRSSHYKTILNFTDQQNNATPETPDNSATGQTVTFSDKEKQIILLHYMDELRDWATQMAMPQRVIATAYMYFKRFFALNQIKDCDPLLLAPTALLMASKIEENPVNCKNIMKVLPSEFTGQEAKYQMQNILDCETYLMEQMDFNLTIFHPYKPLQLYIETLKLEHETEFVQTAWTFVNDSYYCDAPLLYPPFMIAIAALYMSHQFHCRRNDTEEKIRIFRERDEKLRQWLDGLNIHMRQIGAITNLILDMYKILKDMKTGDLIAVPLFKITKLRNNNGWNIPQYPPPVQHQRPNNQMPPQMYMPNTGPPVQQQYQQRF